jgi:hypothetical protein
MSCHGVHDIRSAAWLRTFEGRAAMAQACASCHPSQVADARDVHAARAGCTDCHGAHDIQPVRDPRTRGVALATARRCATCHAREAAAYWADAHGARALRDAASPAALGADTAPVCVDCHRGHAVRNPADTAAHFAFAETCTHCHPAYGATFRENYHGQATQVGSERAALCADCHTAHSIYAASDPRSSVAAANRLATCRRCHVQAAGLFAQYRPHADPRRGSPGLYAVWLTMTLLLGALTLIYVVHAFLVSRRTLIERRRTP